MIGVPAAIGHAYTFMWMFGYPKTFLVCNGLQKVSRPPPYPLDKTDSHWTTRALVPIIWQADRYGARTSPLIIHNSDLVSFDGWGLFLDLLFAMVVISAAVHVKRKMREGRALYFVIVTAMAVIGTVYLLRYPYILANWDSYIFVAVYEPILMGLNALAIMSTFVSGSICVCGLLRKRRGRQLGDTPHFQYNGGAQANGVRGDHG